MKSEYATVQVRLKVLSTQIFLILPEGPSTPIPGGLDDAVAMLNQLGADGWEVIAGSGDQTIHLWTLRRLLD